MINVAGDGCDDPFPCKLHISFYSPPFFPFFLLKHCLKEQLQQRPIPRAQVADPLPFVTGAIFSKIHSRLRPEFRPFSRQLLLNRTLPIWDCALTASKNKTSFDNFLQQTRCIHYIPQINPTLLSCPPLVKHLLPCSPLFSLAVFFFFFFFFFLFFW